MSARIDLSGQRFGIWTVQAYVGANRYKCRCDCGAQKRVLGPNLRKGASTSCGCQRRAELAERNSKVRYAARNLAGERVGRWTVLEPALRTGYWTSRCDCGVQADVHGSSLRAGRSLSCGCLLAEKNAGHRKYGSTKERDRRYAERKRRLYAMDPVYRERRRADARRYEVSEKGKAATARKNARRYGTLGSPRTNGLTAEQWRAVQAAWDHRCAYCERSVTQLTRDHLCAVKNGGPDELMNIVPACLPCNGRKSDFELDEALKRLGVDAARFRERRQRAVEHLQTIGVHSW